MIVVYATRASHGALVPIWIATLASVLVACGTPTSSDAGDVVDAALNRWGCPDEWVPAAVGGCGPAVILCASDGGAASGACAAIDIHTAHPISDGDGGTATSFHLGADDRIAGGWHEDSDPDGYPAADWLPDAGNGTQGDAWAPRTGPPSCPPGWMRATDGTCDPRLATSCPDGAGPLPGDACTATAARDCPATTYADPGPDAIGHAVVHVAEGAPAAIADGSEAHPFPDLVTAIAFAGTGGYVLVAAGDYSCAANITASVHVLGVCAARVSIASPSSAAVFDVNGEATVFVMGGATLTSMGPALVVTNGARASVDRVRVHDTVGRGLDASGLGTRLVATDLFVRDVQSTAAGEGVAIFARGGAAADLTRVSTSHTVLNAVAADGAGTMLHASDAAFVAIDSPLPGHRGAVLADNGAAVMLDRVVVQDAFVNGTTAFAESFLTLRDVVVSHVVHGGGVIGLASRFDVERVTVRDVTGWGIIAADSHVRVADSVVAHIAVPPEARNDGKGIVVTGTLEVAGTHVFDVWNYGVFHAAGATPPTARVDGCEIDHVQVTPESMTGGGIAFVDATRADVTRTSVHDVATFGIAVNTAGEGSLVDSVVRDVQMANGLEALGVGIANGATVTMSRFVIERVMGIHAGVYGVGTGVTIDHSVIRHGVIAPVAQGPSAFGVLVVDGAHALLSHDRIDDVPEFGIVVAASSDFGASVDLEDSLVASTRAVSARADVAPFGTALDVRDGTGANVRRTLFDHNSPLGVIATESSTVTLRECAFRDTHNSGEFAAATALLALGDSTIDGAYVLVESGDDTGATTLERGHLVLRDAIVRDTHTDRFGFGTGLVSTGSGAIDLERVAIVDTHGAALMATPYQDPVTPRSAGAHIAAADLFVRGVGASTIRVEYDGDGNPLVSGQPASYGAHVGADCSMDLSRAVFVNAAFGFYASSGALTYRDGVIAGMSTSAGAFSAISPTVEQVSFVGNASDAIVSRSDLPEGATLQLPQAPCATPSCL